MNVTLTFAPAMLAVIDQALQGMPFRVAAPVIQEINRQIAQQQEPPPDLHNALGQEI